ncbi:MAG: hypothetical protein ACE5FO_08375 [Parvularculaceae bacterium]
MDRHILITNGRSGSNYFVQMLNQHPAIVNYGEVLGRWTFAGRFFLPLFGRKGAGAYLGWLWKSSAFFYGAQIYSYAVRKFHGRKTHFRNRKNIRTIGVKELIVNLRRRDLVDRLVDDETLKVVTLVRENPLDRYVSGALLAKTGMVARTKNEPVSIERIRLDTDRLLQSLDTIQEENDAIAGVANRVGPDRVFRLSYEKYFGADESKRLEPKLALLEFLGVEPMDLPAEHKRIRQQDLPAVLENYEDVAARLAGTRYEKYLGADV